jgi:hypothetical protein
MDLELQFFARLDLLGQVDRQRRSKAVPIVAELELQIVWLALKVEGCGGDLHALSIEDDLVSCLLELERVLNTSVDRLSVEIDGQVHVQVLSLHGIDVRVGELVGRAAAWRRNRWLIGSRLLLLLRGNQLGNLFDRGVGELVLVSAHQRRKAGEVIVQ